MRSSSKALLVLLLTAAAVASALALQWASTSHRVTMLTVNFDKPLSLPFPWPIRGWHNDDWAIGLAIAQVQLAAAATVLCRRHLWLRLFGLTCCIVFWTIAIATAALWDAHMQLVFAWQLVATGLITSAWCGGLTFLGWQIDASHDPATNVPTNPRQFSLATLLISMTIVGGYCGVAKLSGFTSGDISELLLVVLFTIVGCAMFTGHAGARGMALFALVFAGSVATPWLCEFTSAWRFSAASLLRVLVAQLSMLGATIFVLRIAGMRLGSSARNFPQPSPFARLRVDNASAAY